LLRKAHSCQAWARGAFITFCALAGMGVHMKYSYTVFEQPLSLPEYGAYTAFGVSVSPKGKAHILQSFPDVSTNKESLAALVLQCNRLQLHPIHLRDVIDDFLEG